MPSSAPAPRATQPGGFTPRQPAAGRLDLGDAGGSFFSEDDLPEWLRALNPDAALAATGGDRSDAVATTDDRDDHAVDDDAVAVPVPTVTSVWVTGAGATQRSSGAALFATIANAAEERPDVVADESPRESRELIRAGARRGAATVTEAGQPTQRREWGDRRFRIYLIAAVIILILLVVAFAAARP